MTGAISFNSLCVDNGSMMVGGNFNYSPGVGIVANNCVALNNSNFSSGNWFLVDSAINTLVLFKGSLFAGGKFKYGDAMVGTILNGIARRGGTTSIPEIKNDYQLNIYPNPVMGNRVIIENNFEANQFILTDISGRQLASLPLKGNTVKQEVVLPAVASGMYIIGISNTKGEKILKKVVVD
jgi:hypothetical protein